MQELKPCPFCGGEAKYKMKYGSYGYTPDIHKVVCSHCGAEISMSFEYVDCRDAVIDKWNRRSS